ncbi:MAG: hypothetical protein WBP13_01010 [Methylophilaceae bacterium]
MITAKKLTLLGALTKELGSLQQPVISTYQLGKLIFNAYIHNAIGEISLNLKKSFPDKPQYNAAANELLNLGVLTKLSGVSGNYFKIIGKTDVEPDEIICSIDPFCYLSHLSAMAYHGVTDRLPRTVFVSTPSIKEWKYFASEQMQKDLGSYYGQYVEHRLPRLTRPNVKKIAGSIINITHSSHLGAYRNVQGKALRVSTIGRTFLDMLRAPELCGGMQHVIDVYKNYSKQYFRQILDEVDKYGKNIERSRAGYILESIVNLSDPRIDAWQSQVQRGGSRKLDSSNEYSPFFSERWAISLNLPSVSANAD